MVAILLLFVFFALCMISKVSAAAQNAEILLCNCESYYRDIKDEIVETQKHCYIIREEKIIETTYLTKVVQNTLQGSESRTIIGEKCDLPEISTNVKLFTDYHVYNLWYTPHYRLQQLSWTDSQGFRRYNNDYIVALGSYYSTDIGDRFKITLDTGKTFTVILGDGKVDADCDSKNMYTPCIDYEGNAAANLLEFVIDENVMLVEVYSYGSVDYIEDFQGDVVEMVYLGRDSSQDWDLYEIY